ncbi:MAG: dihydrolipoamide acyltransferase [Rhodocyclaceae bacterium]|nr:dihydrolipoamide acyltransferase [Rhodocyclaceae bacterium]
MANVVEVRMPKFPECWETCGNCAQGDVFVIEVHIKSGDLLRFDDNLITLETGKVALDIPTPHAGRVLDVLVSEGDPLNEGQVICTLDAD